MLEGRKVSAVNGWLSAVISQYITLRPGDVLSSHYTIHHREREDGKQQSDREQDLSKRSYREDDEPYACYLLT